MAIPTRRTSARLSGGSTSDSLPPSLDLLSQTTRKKRLSANGVTLNGAEDVFGKVDGTDGTRKRQRTADKPVVMRKTKTTMAFKPIPLANSSDTPNEDLPPAGRPPPPPPSERRIARRRPTARAIERSPSPVLVVPVEKPAKKAGNAVASTSTKIQNSKAKQVEQAASDHQGNESRPAVQEQVSGLEQGVTIQAELGQEQRRWNDIVNNAENTGEASSGSLNYLSFSEPEALQFSAPRPISPPRKAAISTFQTPRASRRVKDVSLDAIVPIALSDTPMIRKNQEMRREASRRSSLGNRGSRMSGSISRGEISTPHQDVPTQTLYKHLGNDLPQTLRARHLMLWCIKRAVIADKMASAAAKAAAEKKTRSKGKGKAKEPPRTVEGDKMVSEIMADLLLAQSKGDVEDGIYGLPSDPKPDTGLRPHPRNEANRKEEAKFNRDLARDKAEDAEWVDIVARANAHREQVLAERQEWKRKQGQDADESEAIPDFTGREAGIERLQSWAEIAREVLDAGDDIEAMPLDDVEYHVDVMHQSSHAAVQYSATATKFLDGIFASLAQDLRNRDQLGAPSTLKDNNNDQDGPALSVAGFVSEIRPGPAATSSKPRNALELLKSLSADDDAEQDDALLADLNPLPLMSNSLNVPSGSAGMSSTRTISAQSNHSTNGSGSTTMTPRRPGSGLGGITPRKIGMLTAPTPRRDNSKRAVSPAMLI